MTKIIHMKAVDTVVVVHNVSCKTKILLIEH